MTAPRRRSLFENIVLAAKADKPIHLSAQDTRRLAGVLDIARRAAWYRKVLDKHPAPPGENPTDWVRGQRWRDRNTP